MTRLREGLTYSNVLATVSIFIALGGTALAFQLGRNSVKSKNIAPQAVRASDIASGAVGSQQLAPGAVGPAQVANAAIGQAQLGDGAVGRTQVANAAIGQAQLGDGAVGRTQVANAAIGQAQLADGAVGPAQVANAAIGQAQLADGAVGFGALADGAVGASKLAPAAVGPGAIADNAVGAANLDQALRLRCPATPPATVYFAGVCIETAVRGVDIWSNGFADCQDEGRRLPTGAELLLFRNEPGVSLSNAEGSVGIELREHRRRLPGRRRRLHFHSPSDRGLRRR